MALSRANRKGRSLERAVQVIEETIIRKSPSLRTAAFEIEPRKVITVDGVRHEIDLCVRVQQGTHFEALHIFEAKNWNTPIGKSEILDFSEKIRITGAAKGYFVAKQFSSSARARAQQDKHMELVEVTDEFVSALDSLQLVSSEHRLEKLTINIKERNVASVDNPPLLNHQQTCHFKGTPTTLGAFCVGETEKLVSEAIRKSIAQFRLVGTHHNRKQYYFQFDPRELLIGTIDVEHLMLDVRFSVVTAAAQVISKFEVEGRGRVYTFQAQSIDNPSLAIQVELVEVIPRNKLTSLSVKPSSPTGKT
jgi:hypothetical protein